MNEIRKPTDKISKILECYLKEWHGIIIKHEKLKKKYRNYIEIATHEKWQA